MLSVVIPAHDEEETLEACLASVLAQDAAFPVQVVVCVNGSTDRTAEIALAHADPFAARSMVLTIVITGTPGKAHALNLAERFCAFPSRVYLDADTTISPGMLRALAAVLARPESAYACAQLRAMAGADAFSRAYVEVWGRLPAIRDDAHGIGLYAVNAAGRRRWPTFPDLHSDDKFVRLLFAPHERHKVTDESYAFPIAGGLAGLIGLRTRWCRGNRELRARYPELRENLGVRLSSYAAFVTGIPARPIASLLCLAVFVVAALAALAGRRPGAEGAGARRRSAPSLRGCAADRSRSCL